MISLYRQFFIPMAVADRLRMIGTPLLHLNETFYDADCIYPSKF